MKLLLRAQDIGWTTVGLGDEEGRVVHAQRFDSRPETILNRIIEAIDSWGVSSNELQAVAVVRGPGSFTAIRNALTIAHTLAFVRQIPIGGIIGKPEATDQAVMRKLAQAPTLPGSIAPFYGAKAMITKPNKRRFHS